MNDDAPQEEQHAAAETIPCAPLPVRPDYYPAPGKLTRELKRAPAAYEALRVAVRDVLDGFRVGRAFDPKPLLAPIREVVASVIRHPEAMVWMRKLDSEHVYLTGHSTRSAVLAAVLARGIGLPERQIERTILGAALSQIGKTRIPRSLLEKSSALSDEEMERIRKFVTLGADILRASPALEDEVADIVLSHQERFDGSGYPRGLKGDAIPLPARIAGLVDFYDAMTTRKPHTSRVISATDALDFLYEQRGALFQPELVEQFIKAMGIYPTGNLVELNTGEVGLVEAQNPGHRTQPLLLIVLDARKKELAQFRHVNLLEHNRTTDGPPLTIAQALGAGAFDLDPATIMRKQAAQRKGFLSRFGL